MTSPAADATRVLVCRDPDGRTHLLPPDAPRREGCAEATIPLSLDQVRWAQALPRAPRPGAPLILEGSGRGEAFRPGSARFAEPARKPDGAPGLPLGLNLLPRLAPRPFGIEERVSVARTGDALDLVCRAGTKPAGLILDTAEARLPTGPSYSIELEAEGAPGFSIGLAIRGGTPDSVSPLGAPTTLLPAPADPLARGKFWPVILCPPDGGHIVLRAFTLAPERAASKPAARSAWAWKPALWRDAPERLLDEAIRHRLDALFVAVEIEGDTLRDEAAFARFVAQARRRGVAVTVVEGDPMMVLEAGRRAAVARLQAIVSYQSRASAEARLAGVQYDIEPYVLPAFAADPQPILRGWAATVERLAAAAGPLPLDMVLPFWLVDDAEAAALVLPAIRRAAASVTVMAYRTSPEAVQAAAEPFLTWGVAAGKPVRVALETGPVEDEVSRSYAAAERGPVLVAQTTAGALVLYLGEPLAGPDAQAFAMVRETVAPADRISFLGNNDAMASVSANLETELQSWPSFAGLAFHGLIQ